MPTSLRLCDPRILLAAVLLSVSLSGCDTLDDWFSKSKKPLPGERVSVFQDRSEIQPDNGVGAVTLPQPQVNDSWPQSGGFPNNDMQNLAVGASPRVIWSADIGVGSSSSRVLTEPPVVAGGMVFVKDATGTVSSFRADTGEKVWSVTLAPEKARDADEFGGGLAWYQNRLFVTTGWADVYSLDATSGKEVWHSNVNAPVRGAPLVFGDRVLCVSIDNKLHALAAIDGAETWTVNGLQETAGYVPSNSPAAAGDLVVAPFLSGELIAVHLGNGRSAWNESLVGRSRELRAFGNIVDIRGRPVIDRNLVFAMGSSGTVAAIDLQSGQRRWERNVGGSQTPWVAGRFVYILSNSADVAALERDTGKVKWVTPLTQYLDEKRQKLILWGGPVLAGDRLLITGTTGEMLALSPYTGEIMGKIDLKAPTRLAPVVANQTIYVLTDTGRLIALR
jgi:outer membrane protein assembly factor BamB